MRHLTLTFALLMASAPVFAQGTGSSIEKSLGSMQEVSDRVQAEVTPPDAEKMQEKAEKFMQGLAGTEAAGGDGAPAKSESDSQPERKADTPQSASASNPSSPQSGPAGGMQGMSGARVNSGSSPRPVESSGTGALSEMTEKNTLDPTPPGGKVEMPTDGDTVLPRNRKSKRAGIRTGEGKTGTDQASLSGQSVAAKPARKIPGFVELN